MANRCAELHDSILAAAWRGRHNEVIFIFSSLYIHESDGEPGVDDGIGWFQRAEMVIENSSITELPTKWPCSIWTGDTEINGISHSNTFPLPLECENGFTIYFQMADDDEKPWKVKISGTGAKLTLPGKPGATEEFRSSKK